jgi:hypothetical protein
MRRPQTEPPFLKRKGTEKTETPFINVRTRIRKPPIDRWDRTHSLSYRLTGEDLELAKRHFAEAYQIL